MEKIRTIAIDDEPLALSLLTSYINKTGFLELIGEFDNPVDAIEFLNKNETDLIITDIQMPDLSGIEFIQSLLNPPKLIFTTAFEKYALESYKVNAVDYLLKPFSYKEFILAVQKVQKLIGLEAKASLQAEESSQFLFLKSEYKIRKITFDDIIYIEGMKDYIKVHTGADTKPILSISTIKSIEKKLPSSKFMRVHRSFIVNLNKITVVERSRIIFGNSYIPVSDQYKDQFQAFLNSNFL